MTRAIFLLLLVFAATGCQDAPIPQIGGISGSTSAAGKPLPESTKITFTLASQDESFSTPVQADGRYHYKPATGVPVRPGEYKVIITPPGPKMIIVDGMESPDPNDKEKYDQIPEKYRNKATTPLNVNVTGDVMQYDIKLE